MKKCMKKGFAFSLALMLILSAMSVFAFAETPTVEAKGSFEVTGYEVYNTKSNVVTSYITKGSQVDILVTMKYNGTSSTEQSAEQLDVTRLVDSFNGGTISDTEMTSKSGQTFAFKTKIKGLTYKGTGNSLKLMVKNGENEYQNIEVPISECKEYTEPAEDPTPSTPDPIPAPKVIMTRNELAGDVKAGDELLLTISVKNIGSATINNPILSFTPSDSLIVTSADSAVQMKSIAVGKTEIAQVKVRVLNPVASVNQYLDAKLDFTYFNRVTTTDGEASARINIPAKVKKTDDQTDADTASPVPNLIVSRFSYGGGSVAAGSKFSLTFKFRNTSRTINAENMVVTVTGGEGLTISGSSNTFYFDKVKAGKSQSITVPMKVANTVTETAQDVSINFKYEYLDHKKRTSTTSDIKISVPLYQPDRFEISNPVVPDYVEEGQEAAITMNYINKSKTVMSNVEAVVDGDVTTQTAVQEIGNLDAGKSGTIAFAVTPNSTGEVDFTITINYEDGNGEAKTRIFPVTMNVQEAVPYDPGTDDPGTDDPGQDTNGGFPWWILAVAAVVIAIAAAVIVKKRKKAKAAKKEQELWDSWDDEMKSISDNSSAADDNKNAVGKKEV